MVNRRVAVALVLLAALALPVAAERVRIIYTNDLHARLERLASAERWIVEARASGDPVLLVDAGDAWQDFRVPLYAVWGAERMVEWMNHVGYDAMAPGNHDLYCGWPKIGDLVASAAFPIVCASLTSADRQPIPFAASVRRTVGSLDVLIVGLGPLEHLPTLDIPWLRPVDPAGALRKEIDAARDDPDLIVCLAHVPVREAEFIARAVPDVDIFVTGHSHETTPVPVVVGSSLIVQSGAFGRNVGELVIDVEDGVVRLIDHALLPTTEEAATDVGRGLILLLQIIVGLVAFCLVLAL